MNLFIIAAKNDKRGERKVMRRLDNDNNVYIDPSGRRWIKIRDVGYELYGCIKDNGDFGWAGGNVGPGAGWKIVEPKDQTKEDSDFLKEVEDVPYHA